MSIYFAGTPPEQLLASIKPTRVRRRRVCNCPYCGSVTPLEPKARGEDSISVTACHNHGCHMVFQSDAVASWLEDPL